MEKVRLGDMGEFARGISKHRPRNALELYEGGGFPLIQTGDISRSNFKITNHSQEYNEIGIQQSKIWPAGTLAITIAANIAETGILSYPMAFPDSVVGFNAYEDRTTNEFVHYLIVNFRKSIQQNTKSSGSIQDNINLEFLNNLKLFFPSLPDQKAIVGILSALDEKITLNNKINHILENYAHTIYDYMCVQGAKDEWQVIKLGELFSENEKSKIKVKEALDTSVGRYPFFTSGETIKSLDEMMVSGSNLFLSTGGNFVVQFMIGDASYSTDTYSITSDHPEFTYFFILERKEYINKYLFTGSGLKHLQKTGFKKLKVKLPDNQILIDFHDQVAPIFQKIQINNQESAKLAKLRDFLLPQLMSGRVKVID